MNIGKKNLKNLKDAAFKFNKCEIKNGINLIDFSKTLEKLVFICKTNEN